jgi:molybdopterin-guanine dinucleotide biosynthesis protein A
MNIIIPLGGVGSRFAAEGYTRPKPLIRVLGKEMIRWVLDSLDLQPNDQVRASCRPCQCSPVLRSRLAIPHQRAAAVGSAPEGAGIGATG